MAVKQYGGSGSQAGRHGLGLVGIEADEDEALPAGTVALDFGAEAAKEALGEFEDFEDAVGGNEGCDGGSGVGQQDVFEIVGAGGQDGGAFVDLVGIEKVEDGKMLNRKDLIHAFEREAALAVEEIRDVGLLESGELGEAETGKFAILNALPENFPEVFLQDPKLHEPEYTTAK